MQDFGRVNLECIYLSKLDQYSMQFNTAVAEVQEAGNLVWGNAIGVIEWEVSCNELVLLLG